MLRILWWCSLSGVVLSLLLLLLTTLQIEALPATSTTATTHIVSYVHQRKLAKTQKPGQHDEFSDFDFENFSSNLTTKNPEMRGALQQLFGRFVENLETNLDNIGKVNDEVPKNAQLLQDSSSNSIQDNEIFNKAETDDLMELQANTLDGGFGNNEQHESQINETMWQRSKQSIPVLESVRHLVNSVRDGALNNHTLLRPQNHQPMMMSENDNGTSAIETEQEREMINESNDLKFLEVLGSFGSRIWGFLSSLKSVFAASSGSASAALSAQSSSSSSK